MMSNFNKEQQEAIDTIQGPLLVVAGPGSGKTTVIVNRVKNMVDKGIKPSSILVITFTKAAADEMAKRYIKIGGVQGPVFSTIHSICLKILVTSFGYSYDDIYKQSDVWLAMRQIVKEYDIDTPDITRYIQKMLSNISFIKNNELTESQINKKEWGRPLFEVKKVMKAYEMQKGNKIDFDDMLILCRKYFLKYPDILKSWQNLFPYICVDEAQDTNWVQAKIIYMLAQSSKNLCMVGDDDQSLYSFRGADPKVLMDFKERFHAKQICLNTNYRSGNNIVESALSLINTNKVRFKKDLNAFNTGGSVNILSVKNIQEQADLIMQQIQDIHDLGTPYSEIAVIFRTNAESTMMLNKCIQQKIPFNIKKDSANIIYEHWIFDDLKRIYYLSKNLYDAKISDIATAMKRPTRFVSKQVLKGCKKFTDIKQNLRLMNKPRVLKNVVKFEDLLNQMRTMSFHEMMQCIDTVYGYRKGLKDFADYFKEDENDLMNTYDQLLSESLNFSSFEEWTKYADQYVYKIKKQMNEKKLIDGVNLVTMHASKGLEYDYVFIINAVEGVAPYSKSIDDGNIEEERRMFYVAMTRAKKHLTILVPQEQRGKVLIESRFAKQIS